MGQGNSRSCRDHPASSQDQHGQGPSVTTLWRLTRLGTIVNYQALALQDNGLDRGFYRSGDHHRTRQSSRAAGDRSGRDNNPLRICLERTNQQIENKSIPGSTDNFWRQRSAWHLLLRTPGWLSNFFRQQKNSPSLEHPTRLCQDLQGQQKKTQEC